MTNLQAGLWALCLATAGCARLDTLAARSEEPRPSLNAQDLAVASAPEGQAFSIAPATPSTKLSEAELVSFVAGPQWVSSLALPDTPLVLHIDEAVATARVTGLDDQRVWFGVTQNDAAIPGGFGRTFRLFTGARPPRADERPPFHPGAVVRFTLPVESPSAHNLAIGERASAGDTALDWVVIAPTERTAAFAVFEIIGVRDLYLRLTSADPTE